MRRLGRIIADDRGAVQIIEASLVFPIVFLVVGFLIYLGSYTLQRVSMHNHAQKIAVITSREIAFPGYDELGAEKSSNADFNWVKGKKPNKAQIEKDKKKPSDEYNMQVLDVIVSEMTKLLGDANDENPSTPCLSSIKEMRNDDLKDYQYILKSNKYVDSYYNSVTTCMGKFNKNLTKLTDEENIEEYKPYGEYYNKKYEEHKNN